MREIPLTKGKVAIVDDEDFDYLTQWKWFYTNGYAARRFGPKKKRKIIYMHSFLTNPGDGLFTDHINRNKLDNRKQNLRSCTRAQNSYNRKAGKNNISGYKGVHLKKDGYFQANISINKKLLYLGRYKTAEAAAHAYDEMAKIIAGSFAYLNFDD
jgi:hypothetical protein